MAATQHQERTTEYNWTCPNCNTDNLDDIELTAFPSCSDCYESYFWEDILPRDTPDTA